MPTKLLGHAGVVTRGNYDSGVTYNYNNEVRQDNKMYRSLKENNTAPLTDETAWFMTSEGIGAYTDNNFTDAYKKSVDDSAKDLSQRALNVKSFGASGSDQTTTGTISAGSTALTLASAIDFENGQGISIDHAGAACTLSTPTASTVTPTGTAGTTTYQYQIVALDANGGCSAAGAAGTTTTGNAALSTTNYNAISWAAVTNSTAYAIYGRVSGTMVLLGVTANTSFNDVGATAISYGTLPSSVPVTALADTLITTIASGAGTTSIVLSAAATTDVTAQIANHDDTVAIQNAIYAAKNNPYAVYIPAGNYIVKELFIDNVHGITLYGDRSGHDNQEGSCLIYTGTADCLTIKNTDDSQYSGFIYRVDIKNIAIFAAHACNSFIYAYKIQESTFYNIGLWNESPAIVSNGIILDGAGIIEIDNSTIESVSTGIIIKYNQATGGNGGINITRNNIFKCVRSIEIESAINVNIDKNWIEGFAFALYLANFNPLEVTGLNFTNNNMIQSTSNYAGTEAIKVDSVTPTNRLIAELLIANNTFHMNSSGNPVSDYCIAFNSVSNTSGYCDIRASIINNYFSGIRLAAVFNDNKNTAIKIANNSIRQALFGTDTPKICEGYMISASNSFIIDTSDHTPAYTFSIPKNYLANHGVNIKVYYTVTANADAKTIRFSVNNAAIISNESIANISNGYFELYIIPSDLTHQKLTLYSKCEQDKLTTVSCNYDSSLEIPVLIEKTCPTQGDTVTITSIIASIL